jgi:hypothetical protein
VMSLAFAVWVRIRGNAKAADKANAAA